MNIYKAKGPHGISSIICSPSVNDAKDVAKKLFGEGGLDTIGIHTKSFFQSQSNFKTETDQSLSETAFFLSLRSSDVSKNNLEDIRNNVSDTNEILPSLIDSEYKKEFTGNIHEGSDKAVVYALGGYAKDLDLTNRNEKVRFQNTDMVESIVSINLATINSDPERTAIANIQLIINESYNVSGNSRDINNALGRSLSKLNEIDKNNGLESPIMQDLLKEVSENIATNSNVVHMSKELSKELDEKSEIEIGL